MFKPFDDLKIKKKTDNSWYNYDVNKVNYENILKWLKEENKSKILLIYGNSGAGKTQTIHRVLKDNNYNFTEYDCLHNFTIEDILHSTNNKSINDFFNILPPVIILDEITSIITNNHHINLLKKHVDTLSNPIICVSSDCNLSKLSALKKICTVLKFENISSKILTKVLEDLITKNNIKLTIDAKKYLVKKYENDLSSLANLLFTFKNYSKKINTKKLKSFTTNSICVDNVYDILVNSFSSNDPIEKLDRLYSMDTVSLSYICQENYLLFNDNIDNCSGISDSLSEGDIISTFVYKNQNWEISDYLSYTNLIRPKTLSNVSGLKVENLKASYYLASKPTTNRIIKIYNKINTVLNFSPMETNYIKTIIANDLDRLDILYSKYFVLSQYELLKFLSVMTVKDTIAYKTKIKKKWAAILLSLK